MLLSADHMKWPVNSPGDEKINAGVWFGRTDYVTGWLEKAVAAVPSHPKVVNDQFYYHLLFDPENQRIDYGREFIQTELRPVNIVNDWVKSAYLINLERRADRLRHCRRNWSNGRFSRRGYSLGWMARSRQVRTVGLPAITLRRSEGSDGGRRRARIRA